MERRFVILLHTGHGPDHIDLMVEDGLMLATWQIAPLPPPGQLAGPLAATKLPDHRTEYLTYEGPLSRSRGQVRRIDEGACEVFASSPAIWRIRFDGCLLSGTWELRQEAGSQWRIAPD